MTRRYSEIPPSKLRGVDPITRSKVWRARRARQRIANAITAIAIVASALVSFNISSLPESAAAAVTPGAKDTTFATNVGTLSNKVVSLAKQSDGKIVALGGFAGKLARYSAAGVPDTAFNTNAAAAVANSTYPVNIATSVAVSPLDGKILVTDDYLGPLQRFNADGTADTTFDANAKAAVVSNATAATVAVQSDGKVLMGGNFPAGSGGLVYPAGLVRFNTNGTLDTAFNANITANIGTIVNAIKVQSDGKILVGGSFTGNLKRFNSDGTLDRTFSPGIGTVNTIDVSPNGLIAVGGSSTPWAKVFNADGTAGPTLSPDPSWYVYAVAFQADEKLYVGGSMAAPSLMRYNVDGTKDTTFAPLSSDINTTTNAIVTQGLDAVVIGTLHSPYLSRFYAKYPAPDAPLAPTAVVNSDGTVTVTYTPAPAGITPSKFVMTSVEDPSKTCTVNAATGSCTFSGLTMRGSYTFTSVAYNVTEPSVASPASTAVIAAESILPTYTSVALNAAGNTITLTYSEALNATTAAASRFTVMVNGQLRPVSNPVVTGSTVTLTLSPAIERTDSGITVAYSAPAASALNSNAAIQDSYGNDAVSLATTPLANSSTADFTAPVFQSAMVNPAGTAVALYYDETLSTAIADISRFTVTVAGVPVTISSLTYAGNRIVLNLPSVLNSGDTVTVSYAAPTVDNSSSTNTAIQDAAGNDALSVPTTTASGALARELVNDSTSATAITRNGEILNLKVQTPVADAGSLTQSITQWIDPTRLQLRSAADIVAPAGWTLTYSYDGTTFSSTAPTTSAQWATVQGVKATGLLVSDGADAQGRQIATGEATATTPLAGAFTATGGSGDGWDLIFDDNNHVFNIYHHDGNSNSNPGIDCHLRTGARCAGTWPLMLKTAGGAIAFHTSQRSTGWYDPVDKELWFNSSTATDIGFVCLNVADVSAANIYCGGSQTTAFHSVKTYSDNCLSYIAANNGRNECAYNFAQANGKLFTWDTKNADLMCFDIRLNGGSGAPCVTSPIIDFGADITYAGAKPATDYTAEIVAVGDKIYAANGQTKIACFDTSTMAFCNGWGSTGVKTIGQSYSAGILSLPDAAGNLAAVCSASRLGLTCFDPNTGASVTPNASFVTDYKATRSVYEAQANSPQTSGSRIYWSTGVWNSNSAGLYCWDFKTGARCTNFWGIVHANYTINVDPLNSACIWDNNNDGVIEARDAFTGALGCSSSQIEFAPKAIVPRMGCSTDNSVQGWVNFTLTDPPIANYGTASLTVLDSAGSAIPNWTDLPLTAANNRTIDLSSLTVQTTGQTPKFRVTIKAWTTAAPLKAKITSVGDSPELCVTPITVVNCPSTTAIGPYPIGQLPGSESITVRSAADATNVSGYVRTLQPGTATINLPAASALSCASKLQGTARIFGSTMPFGGAVATLLNSSGQSVLDSNGQPITTTTASNGAYSFGYLVPGDYKVSFADYSTADVVNATGVTAATGTNTVQAADTMVMSTAVALNVGVTGVVDATYAVPAPTANNDTSSGILDAVQTKAVLGNDTTPSVSITYDPTTLALCATGQTAPNCNATSVSVTGGVYSLVTDVNGTLTGEVSFTPTSGFTGTAPPVSYQVAASDGQKVSATYTPTVVGAPSATADTTSGPYNTAQTKSVLGNDNAATGTTLDPTTLKLCPANATAPFTATNCNATSVTVVDPSTGATQGTYSLSGTTVTFTPTASFTGTAVPLNYVVADALGQIATTTYTPTVTAPSPPVPVNDISSGPFNTAQTKSVLTNDTSGLAAGVTIVANTTKLCATGQAAPNCNATTVAVTGGSYAVDNLGVITFTPTSGFTGTAPPVTYQVSTNTGQTGSATYTPTVTPPPVPVLTADTTTGAYNTAQSKTVLSNDNAGTGATLNTATLKLCPANATSPFTATNCNATTVTVVDPTTGATQGTYTLSGTTVTFTPTASFTGTAVPVKYVVADDAGQVVSTTYTPSVSPPPAATAVADTSVGVKNTDQTKSVLTNDTVGAVGVTLVASTAKLCGAGQSSPNCDKTSVTVDHGTYSIDALGVITFTPESNYVGTPQSVTYQVTTNTGEGISTTYSPVVVDGPSAQSDISVGKLNQVQTRTVLSNDTAAGSSNIFALSTMKLCVTGTDPLTCGTTSVTVKDPNNAAITQGTYSLVLDGSSVPTGEIRFTPVTGFTGTATPVTYQITNDNSQTVTTTYTPSVAGPPVTDNETSSGKMGVAQTAPVLVGDTPGTGTSLLPSTLRLCGLADTAPVCTATSLTVVDPSTGATQGTYTISGSDLIFTPDPAFKGTAVPATYAISDALGQSATGTYTPTVIGPPVLVADTTSGAYNTAQTEHALADDTAASGTTLDTASLKLCVTGSTAPFTDVKCSGTSVTVVDPATGATQGTYTISGTDIVFTPTATFTGTAVPVTYLVKDALGQSSTTTYTPTVAAPPPATAVPNTSTKAFNTPETVTVLSNDTVGAVGVTLLASTMRLCAANETAPACSATTVSVVGGTFASDAVGNITFTPTAGFVGTAPAVTYVVTTNTGEKISSTYTPTILPPAPPAADNETSSGPLNAAQSQPVLIGDTVPTGSALAPGTLALCTTSATAPYTDQNCTATSVTVNDPTTGNPQGTYTLGTDGSGARTIIFTPANNFVGTAVPIRYIVEDIYNQPTSATYTPTVTPPGIPVATPDTQVVLPGGTATFNNITGTTPLATGTGLQTSGAQQTCLLTPGTSTCDADNVVVIVGEGTFTLDPATGIVTYVADPSATQGTKTAVSYRVTDAVGQTAVSTLTPIVPPAPVVAPDESSGPFNTAQVKNVMTNDSAGAGATLVPASVKLCQVDDPTTVANEAETANSCTQSSVIAYDPVTQAIQGTYTVANGIITFTPAAEFEGTATPVSYVISDNLGQTLSTTYTPTTLPPALPGAMNDTYSTFPLVPITFNVRTNDNLGSFPLDPTSVRLCEVIDVPPACSATSVSDELGTLVVNTATGEITFTPTALFTEATPAHWRYAIADTRGHFTFANITIVDPPLPTPISRAADLAYTGMNLLGGPVSTSGLIALLVGIALFSSAARKQKFRLATAVFLSELKANTFRALEVDEHKELPEKPREFTQREEWSSRPD